MLDMKPALGTRSTFNRWGLEASGPRVSLGYYGLDLGKDGEANGKDMKRTSRII